MSGFKLALTLANSVLFFFILSFHHALAAPASVWVTPAVVAVDETVTLTIAQDSFSLDMPDLTALKENFRILKQSNSSSITSIKGATVIKKRWVLVLLPLKTGKLMIPAIQIGNERTPPLSVKVTDDSDSNNARVDAGIESDTDSNSDNNAESSSKENSEKDAGEDNQGNKADGDSTPTSAEISTDHSIDQPIIIRVEIDQQPHYVQGQVLLSQKIFHAIPLKTAHLTPPKVKDNAADIVQLSQIEPYYWNIDGKRYHVIERNYALFPKHSGTLTIEKVEFTGETKRQPRTSRKEDPFGLRNNTSTLAPKPSQKLSQKLSTIKAGTILNASAKAITITILQQESTFTAKNWLPAKNMTVYRKWSKPLDTLKQGDTVVMKTSIIADGLRAEQLPEIFLQIPKDLKSYPEQAELTNTITHSGVTGIWSQKVTFVPSQPGEFTLPELKIPWWNITTEREELAKLRKEVLVVGEIHTKSSSTTSTEQQPVGEHLDIRLDDSIDSKLDNKSSINWGYLLFPVLLFFGYLLFRKKNKRLPKKSTHKTVKAHKRTQKNTQHRAQKDTKNSQHLLDELKHACLGNSPQAVEPLLLQWAKQVALIRPSTLEGISNANNGYLRFEVERLSQSLYARSQTNWKGLSLWDAIKKYPYPENTNLRKKEYRLKEMYPTSGTYD